MLKNQSNNGCESDRYQRSPDDSNESPYTSRRSVLRGIAGAGIAGIALTGATGHAKAAESVVLGDFEDGLDRWKTNGGNRLRSVGRNEESAPVTRGDHALEVRVRGDPQPVIRNQKTVQRTDFTNQPYLVADVLPGEIEDTDSPVTFRFRYRSKGPGGVEESPETTVSQRYGARLVWDMSGIAEEKLSSPQRLGIAWYAEEHPPSTSPPGRGSGFDYRGRVYFDNIHLSDDSEQVTLTRWAQKLRALERSYGPRVDSEVEQSTDTVQTGAFVYYDGTEIPYRAEILDGADVRVDIDGETFRFAGVDE